MADNSNGQIKTGDNMESEQNTGAENAKNSEYIKELLKEKMNLDPSQHSHAMRFIDDELALAQSKGKNMRESRYLDIYKEKPVRLAVKVLLPVKEHPRFNFVGKLLGPKGNSLKRLQEDTMTRMAILGRGSMRDRNKEEEFRTALDPKYAHLNDDLHVEIVALAAPAEAHARIAFALAELRKYLVPDSNDEIRHEQLRELQTGGGGPSARGRGGRGGPPQSRQIASSQPRGGMGAPPLLPRPMQNKNKVLSILDRARVAMEETYPEEPQGYYEAQAQGYGGDYNGGSADYYESGYPEYISEPAPGRWKGYKSAGSGPAASRYGGQRSAPYSRPAK